MSKVFPDSSGKVRNVRVMVKSRQGGSANYVPTKAIYVDRHVNNLVLLVPADEQEQLDDDCGDIDDEGGEAVHKPGERQ